MDIFRGAERLMGMSVETWRRHANPWSVWTRFTVLPLIALAIFSRAWIGWWCLLPLAMALAWTWINPRAFPPPPTLDGWPQKGVMGERLFLRRSELDLPQRHVSVALALSTGSAIGAMPMIWGLWTLDGPLTAAGVALTILPKFWFCDRMVWLYEDTERAGALPDALRRGARPGNAGAGHGAPGGGARA